MKIRKQMKARQYRMRLNRLDAKIKECWRRAIAGLDGLIADLKNVAEHAERLAKVALAQSKVQEDGWDG